MTATITAILPTYNRASMLPEAVHSVLAQSRIVNEVIIWDDGSTDNTAEVAHQLATIVANAKNPSIVPDLHYFRSENGGKSRALNQSLKRAKGDYIWICDDDDLGLPHAVETLASLLDSDASLVAAGGCYRRFRDDPGTGERVEQGPGYWPDLATGTPLRHLLEDIFLFQNATLVRKSAYDAVGPFREDLARSIDYDMVVRLACAGPMALINDPVFLQRKHDGDRGPAAARHAAKNSDDAWKLADLDVFRPFRSDIALSMYEAMYEANDPQLVRRAALLQRACVFARRTDWELAVHDLADASKLAPSMTLSPVEKQICKRALGGKHGCVEAFTPTVREALSDVANRSPAGVSIARALARGATWRLRKAIKDMRWGEAASAARFVILLSTRRFGKMGHELPGRVRECSDYPETAYQVIGSSKN